MSAQYRDYYQTLEVSKTASTDEIKSAFRKLARKFHPDTAKDKKAAEEKFKEINEAYEVLGDPEKRKRYDEYGANWEHGVPPQGFPGAGGGFAGARRRASAGGAEDFQFGGTGFSSFFEQMFGSGRQGRRGGFSGRGFDEPPQRGEDAEADIMVTLEEALNGSTRPISFSRGDSKKVETYTIKIPKGICEGQRIRLAGQGGTGSSGGGSGDLYLRVKFQRHPDFEVVGSDLNYELEVPAWKAVLGCEVHIPTLEGRAKLKIPPGTQAGKRFRLPGMGLPVKGGHRGNIYATVSITVPPSVTASEKALWEKISELHRD